MTEYDSLKKQCAVCLGEPLAWIHSCGADDAIFPLAELAQSEMTCNRQPYCLKEKNSMHHCKCETKEEYKKRAGWRAY